MAAPASDPQSAARRAAVRYHAANLALALAVVGLSFTLETDSGDRVFLPGLELVLPESCLFRHVTGYGCPGCGLTRCFISVAHGRWHDAWHFHPAGILLFGLVVLQIPYQALQLRRAASGKVPAPFSGSAAAVVAALAAILLLQWLLRLLG